MAKKSAHSEEELPFAALMDVMTNVVGVLIIVLVLTGITLAQVAKKVIAQIEIVSEEDFKKIQKEAEDAKTKVDPNKVQEELKKIDQEIKSVPILERPPIKVNAKLADLEALKIKLEEARKIRDKEKEQVATYLAKIDELKKRLDTKPRYVAPPPPDTMKMPNPRPLPAKPEFYHFYITSNSVISSYADKKKLEIELGNTLKQFAKESGLSGPKVEFDTTKLWEYLQKNFVPKYKDLTITPLNWLPFTEYITLGFQPKPDPAAPPIDAQLKIGSPFYNTLKEISSKNLQNGVVFFHVAEGGFDNYMRAREIADSMRLNVGWDMDFIGPRSDEWHFWGLRTFNGVEYLRKITGTRPAPGPTPQPTPDTRLIKEESSGTTTLD